jgi:hypothetical protein
VGERAAPAADWTASVLRRIGEFFVFFSSDGGLVGGGWRLGEDTVWNPADIDCRKTLAICVIMLRYAGVG